MHFIFLQTHSLLERVLHFFERHCLLTKRLSHVLLFFRLSYPLFTHKPIILAY